MPRKNNNNKGGNQAPRTTKPARRKTMRAMVQSKPIPRPMRMDPTHQAHKVCALTDPFCPGAVGSKWPNITAAKTLAWPGRGRTSIATDATGTGAIAICPLMEAQIAVGVVTGNSGVFTTTLSAAIPPFPNGIQGFRVVSWGFKIRNVTSPMLSSGIVRIRLFSDLAYPAAAAIDLASYNCVASYDIPLQDCREVCIIPSRVNESSTFFQQTTATNGLLAGQLPSGWTFATVAVFGAPVSAAPLDVELFMNNELQFADNSSMQMLATPSPPTNTMLQQAASYVSEKIGPFVKNGAQAVENEALKYARKYLIRSLGGLGGPMGSLAGSMLALTVD